MPLEATPLFRPEILRPHVRAFEVPEFAAEHRGRLQRWVDLLDSPEGVGQKETELLPDFITDVFQRLLGYTGPAEATDGRYTLSREKLVEVDGKFADAVLGTFGQGDERFTVAVEGKGPRDPLERPFGGRRMSAVDQAYRYAINLPCEWILVTNLREIRLYHKGSTQRQYERFELEEVAASEEEFKRFLFVLGAERVVGAAGRSHLHDLLEASRKAGERLTQEFYRAYADIRHDLLNELLKDNPDTEPAAVLSAAQRLLDRTLFVAFAEDRSLLPADSLAQAYEHRDPYNPRPIWHNFRGLFKAIDEGNASLGIPRYNGGLFAEHALLDREMTVSDHACEFLKRLGDYNYGSPSDVDSGEDEAALVDVEILGHIFEQSIEDLEAIQAEIEGGEEVSRSSSKRKRQGAFYTPAYVTRYIVTEALRPVLDETFEALRKEHQRNAKGTTAVSVLESPYVYEADSLNNPQREALIAFWEAWIEKLKAIRVVDPACGSGAFLVEVFDALHAEYDRAVGHLTELRPGGWAGSLFDPDRTILEKNVYGVDLNEEAVEIARLSIWIKTAQRGKVLTDLDHNVQVGNSVVEDSSLDPRAFEWWKAFPEVEKQGGFDVVVGNPPYVRAERLTGVKGYLEEHYATYAGTADLYVYFYELGVRLLRPGGRMSYIVTNKWLKTGYAEPLRRFFAHQTWVEEIVDLGHARQIFPDADVFPCILRVRKPVEGSDPSDPIVCVIPRDEVDVSDLSEQIRARGFGLRQAELDEGLWTLEPPALADLMAKLRSAGPTLPDFLGVDPCYGVKTGANKIFVIDEATRDRLVSEDPSSAEVLKPCIRGNEIERWQANPGQEWLIFARRGIQINRYPAVKRYLEQYREQLAPRPDDWSDASTWPGRKPGGYAWYELQDTVDYWRGFERPKILHTDIAWRPQFAIEQEPLYPLNTAYAWPSDDLYVLGVLNSPLLWAYMWRNAQHGKDEALRLIASFITTIPIAEPKPEVRAGVESRVDTLVSAARERQHASVALHDWLRVEFGIEKPGQKLAEPHRLHSDEFIAEVKKRRPKTSGISSSELRRLREEYEASVAPVQEQAREVLALEREISSLVNDAYGLTEEERDLLWRTAPPRMPIPRPESTVSVAAA